MDIRYLTDGYDEGIARLKAIDAPLNFVFITDVHHRLESDGRLDLSSIPAIQSIEYILQRVPNIQCVVSGGDVGDDYNPDPDKYRATFKEYMDALYALSRPVHHCVGNHDDRLGRSHEYGWNTDYVMRPKEMHDLCMKYNPTEENYYYADIDTAEQNYRLVFLNTSDYLLATDESGQIITNEHGEISHKQADWYEREALNTDRKIVVFSHCPIHNAGIYGSTPDADITPYDDVFNAPRVYYHSKRCENVVAMIAGHVHYDNVAFDEHLPTITTAAGYVRRWDGGVPERVIGTPTEALFDVFSIKGDRLYITRFGAGEHRELPLLRLRSTRWNRPYVK